MLSPLKLGILGSGRGSNFVALAQAINSGVLNAQIQVVASDLEHALILTEARHRSLPTYSTAPSRFKTKLEPEIEQALAEALVQRGAELVVLVGFMRVIKQPLLQAFPGRILNIHPSLLPAFKGLAAWEQALEAGVVETGCSVHWVDDSLDGGPVIRQARVPILPGDSADSLHRRIQEQEHRLLPEVLQDIATGKITLPE
jgi:phosphoribosylglycinamide formyltransferase 1